MFNNSLFLVIVLATFGGTLCSPGHFIKTSDISTSSTVNSTEALARLNKGSIALTGEFLYQLLANNPNTNVVASATSAMMPLAQLAYFATGLVSEQLLGLLNLQSKDEIKSVFSSVVADYGNQAQVVFDVENQLYGNINDNLTSNFIQFHKVVFRGGAENIDFSENFDAADKINDWVAESTNDKITNLVSPDMFSADTRLVLCNAIYFLGNWQHQFNPNKTETKDFYLDNTNKIKVPIMYQENSFNYYEEDGLQALEMSYKNSNFSFLAILPRDKGIDAVKTIADKLRNPDTFTGILDNMSYQKVQVSLPRMLIDTSIDLAKILKEDNVTEIFNPDSNGLSGILERPEPIYVSDAVQKAFISVDETGTEAAAASAIGMTTLSLPVNPPPVCVFNANPVIGATATSVEYPSQFDVFEATRPHLIYLLVHRIPMFGGAFFGK